MRGKVMATGNRRDDKIPTTLNLDKEARRILDEEAGGHIRGAFVNRLLYEHRARKEERERLGREQPQNA
jgi:hypothetical protein